MKTWLKVVLIALLCGAVLMIAGFAAGGRTNVYFDNRKLQIDDGVGDKVSQLNIDAIREIQIDVSAARIEIVQGDSYGYETESYRQASRIVSSFENGRLVVEQKSTGFWGQIGWNFNLHFDRVTVYLPADANLDNVSIRTSAGDVRIGSLSAQNADLHATAGAIHIEHITAPNLSLTATTGSIRVDDLVVTESLKAKVTAGELRLSGTASGDIDVSNVTGEVRLDGDFSGRINVSNTTGEIRINDRKGKEAFTMSISCTVGDLRVNGQKVSSGTYGDGPNKLTASATTGELQLNFGAN